MSSRILHYNPARLGLNGVDTSSEVTSNVLDISGIKQATFIINFSHSAATQVDIVFDISMDNSVWAPVQIEDVTSTIIYLHDRIERRGVSADDKWPIHLHWLSAQYLRVRIISDGGASDTATVYGYLTKIGN